MNLRWPKLNNGSSSRTLGRLLKVSLPQLGLNEVMAKIDTGAYNGALHATGIREVRDADGITLLRFIPYGATQPVELEQFHKRRVKSSNGLLSTRYAIDTEVSINGQVYPITLTLANRSSMRNPMLIGRNFLRTHKFLIDVSQHKK